MKKARRLLISGRFVIKVYRAGTRELMRTLGPFKNRIVSGSGGYGRNIVARVLGGDNTYSLNLTNAKIGTGTNTPADSDTDLQTAVVSTIRVASTSISASSVVISFFMPDADLPDGVYSEFGIFAGGTGPSYADARLFARSLIEPNHTKAAGEDTVIDYNISITI